MPLTVYSLTENTFNIGEKSGESLKKRQTNNRTKSRKASGKRRDYSMTGLIGASFPD